MNNEFNIISTYFKSLENIKNPVNLGIGDDAAVVTVPSGYELAITVDTLVGDIHFFSNISPESIAHKALAVNLSDLAAMGAKPSWITLALTLPKADKDWLELFSKTLGKLLNQYDIQLIGGDLTHGPLCISIQAAGLLPHNQRLTRSGAKPGDLIYVSGTLGDAALAFELIKSKQFDSKNPEHEYLINRLEKPTPRVEFGQTLLSIASSCIDISDGLAADLGHILEQSHVGGEIDLAQIPVSQAFLNHASDEQQLDLALKFGDDYELCFTVAEEKVGQLKPYIKQKFIKQIGQITQNKDFIFLDKEGRIATVKAKGYQHF